MPKTKTQKANTVQEIETALKKQKSLLFLDYKGLKVKDLVQLRKQLKEAGAKLQVAKKTLLARAFQKEGIEEDFKNREGQIALVYSFEDPLAGIKTANTFAKGNENVKLLGGYMENQLLDQNQVKELALLPSKEQLLGMFVRTLKAPIRSFAVVLEGNIKGLIRILTQVKTL